MNDEFSYPYRRFSSDLFASSLIALLDENNIPFEIVSEPEGVGSVFVGAAGVPGVIIMLTPADAKRVQLLEAKTQPVEKELPQLHQEQTSEFDTIHPAWIFIGYLLSMPAAPIAIIFGLHLFSAKRKNKDLTFRYAYRSSTRTHGRIIFWGALLLFVYGLLTLLSAGTSGNILDSASFVFSYLRHR